MEKLHSVSLVFIKWNTIANTMRIVKAINSEEALWKVYIQEEVWKYKDYVLLTFTVMPHDCIEEQEDQ